MTAAEQRIAALEAEMTELRALIRQWEGILKLTFEAGRESVLNPARPQRPPRQSHLHAVPDGA